MALLRTAIMARNPVVMDLMTKINLFLKRSKERTLVQNASMSPKIRKKTSRSPRRRSISLKRKMESRKLISLMKKYLTKARTMKIRDLNMALKRRARRKNPAKSPNPNRHLRMAQPPNPRKNGKNTLLMMKMIIPKSLIMGQRRRRPKRRRSPRKILKRPRNLNQDRNHHLNLRQRSHPERKRSKRSPNISGSGGKSWMTTTLSRSGEHLNIRVQSLPLLMNLSRSMSSFGMTAAL